MNKFLIIMLASITLLGCETIGGPKQTGGTIFGGATGALLGSQVGGGSGRLVGVAIGTFLGSQIGATIGKQMDEHDKMLASQTAVRALEHQPDNQTVAWKNPNNQHSGNFTITHTQENLSANQVCRDYVHTVNIDGEQQKVHGRACRDVRDTKGQWMVVQ